MVTEARLRLAIGAAAVLGDEQPTAGGWRTFVARGPDDPPEGPPTRLVVLHPAPPDGPVRGRLLERMAAIRSIGHSGLTAPLATGQLDEQAWVVESLPHATTLDRRLETGVPLSVQETVRVMREVARGLSALHRGGMAHGALSAAMVESSPRGVAVHGLGRSDDGTIAGDLHALGGIGWLSLTAKPVAATDRRPSVVREGVPEALDRLVARLLDPDPVARPASAEAVLEALDWFPVREATPLRALIDGAGRGARTPNERRAAIALALVGLAILVLWLLTRRG